MDDKHSSKKQNIINIDLDNKLSINRKKVHELTEAEKKWIENIEYSTQDKPSIKKIDKDK
ncbi:MAG: hypothetical protein A3F18_01505 [Legionellales bacterium RIFCSPHIGHO2_12_FULL_37_14]|nr:MAG: hypothetical protein A3F18_01505 [Legionellales bacterium RIFCSPHIGHO2_12_FULL_37_14]